MHRPVRTARTPGKTDGEEFYFAAKIHLGDALFTAAKALKAGELPRPVRQPTGSTSWPWPGTCLPVPDTFASARSKVLADYKQDAIARLQNGDSSFFRKRANVLIAEDLR